ncbi:uncharacterized protein KIAA1958-like [Mytilus trossulus]|uniref:uncharacterized protein KIAA1958-like n=1 Tax=Mytilus trossulus TaxID=6551 RepID=UPI003003F8B7
MILKEAMMADAFSLPLESLPDWLEIENVDTDDLVLSQVLQEVEEDMSLANASETIEENIRLSQIHSNMEPFYNMSVSQAVDYYHLGTFELGDFLLTDLKDEDVEPVRFTTPVLDEDVEPVRFTAPVSDEDIEKLISSQANANTKKNTKWSIGVFNEWRIARSKHGDSIADIHMLEAAEMNHWLQRFVIEVRNKKGEEYPPKSLYSIICGLLRYCKDMNVNDKNFLDEKDLRFVTFRRVLDSRMKELLSKGFGTKVKRADPLSLQDEENLWQKGFFGMTNSVSLQHTAFFYACKLFGLRGRDEHRNLDCSQFEIGTDQTGKYVRFIGRSTKTFKGGLSHLSLDNKDIKHYSEEGPRCIATHFQKY